MPDTDILTQLQQSLDQLLAQFYASLRYLDTHHPSSAVPGSGSTSSNPFNPSTQDAAKPPPSPPPPTNDNTPPNPAPQDTVTATDAPSDFRAAQVELAHDLILKHGQIRGLINALPGLESSEEDQERRLRLLDQELLGVLEEREGVERERGRVLGGLEAGVIAGMGRGR